MTGRTRGAQAELRRERVPPDDVSRVGAATVGVVSAVGFAAIALVAFASHGPPMVDEVVTAGLVSHRAPALTVVAVAITNMGAAGGLIPLVIVMIGVLRTLSGRWGRSVQLFATMLVSAGLSTLIKIATARVRPPTVLEMGHHTTSFAFPSGHTLNTTTFVAMSAALLAASLPPRRRGLLWVAAATASGLMGWSRVYLGFHWLSDVAAGWFLAGFLVSVSILVAGSVTPNDLTSGGGEE